ncbi:MAG: WYL domain-containing protein [Bacteroidaceae bacterium]|nr:WYL domain-containing protein [Bacteroidaceae bacterium]
MATNKNAQLRYQILDRCFRNYQKRYEIDDLLDEVNEQLLDIFDTTVSIRQLREDIKYMRDRVSFNAPIVAYPFDGKKCYYRYSDPNFSIYNKELSVTDLNKLQSAIDMLGRFRGTATNVWLEEVISNLEYRFGLKSNAEHLVSFEQNEQLKGIEHLADIIDATVNHQTLEIVYLTFKGKEILMTIHPYYVKQYNGRWFLYGLNNELNRISNLALDRIRKYEKSRISFRKNENYDFSTYFDDVVGVTIPKDDVKIDIIGLRFSANRYPYVESKPIHKSQIVVDKEQGIIEIKVRPTRELDQQLFSFIPDVEVLYPEWYRKHIKEIIKENLKKYLSVKKDCTDNF